MRAMHTIEQRDKTRRARGVFASQVSRVYLHESIYLYIRLSRYFNYTDIANGKRAEREREPYNLFNYINKL